MNRSYLFVPADSERKMKKAADVGADALILDLEDSVAPAARTAARERARDYLAGKENVWVRINPIGSDDAIADLKGVMPSAPAGIVLPKPRSAADAVGLASMLDDLEQEHGVEAGKTGILAICTERPAAVFTLAGYVGATARLAALSWGAEDLSAAVGASGNRDDAGNWLPPYELARSLCLFAAGAAEVPAVDTVFTDYRDAEGLATYAANARRDGFSGMLAIHPAQVDVINRAFVPTAAELERAERIVALFASNPEAGTLGMDGKMIDRPHLVQAQRLLQLAKRLAAL
ncbi:MAG: CoA ester lyase [Gammaproteobacteria bacterium]|jgi:citrate lyase subunit beta/citryl-CoA lyase|nr:CoA ester lyase [Gammaproteobacteria bacterium]MDH3750352.1 CoA ester lyase [Gammaproteobacteria bacterium]